MSAAIRPPGSPAVPGARNRLLSALAVLAPDDAEWLERQLEPAEFESGEVLALAGTSFTQVYFPESAVVSVVSRMADGGAVEVGTVGNEGMASVSSFLDGGASACDTFVQIPGTIRCAPAAAVVDALDTRPAIRRLLNRYTQAYLTQIAQTAACNRLHHIEARCARWLLMTHDRVGGADQFPLTQEFLAIMLGVRRAGVTVAAGALQDAGLIRYRRGGIRVLDRPGLESAACECYAIVRRHFDQLLP
jgi:CRP-like cAMP-binding protein